MPDRLTRRLHEEVDGRTLDSAPVALNRPFWFESCDSKLAAKHSWAAIRIGNSESIFRISIYGDSTHFYASLAVEMPGDSCPAAMSLINSLRGSVWWPTQNQLWESRFQGSIFVRFSSWVRLGTSPPPAYLCSICCLDLAVVPKQRTIAAKFMTVRLPECLMWITVTATTSRSRELSNFAGQCKNSMYSKNGVVYELHAGWFINRLWGGGSL